MGVGGAGAVGIGGATGRGGGGIRLLYFHVRK